MDNAPFHKSKLTRELIESAGCKLLFQPSYSPDLNPIEQQWAIMKRAIKHILQSFEKLYDAIVHFFSVTYSV